MTLARKIRNAPLRELRWSISNPSVTKNERSDVPAIDRRRVPKRPPAGAHLELPNQLANLRRFRRIEPASAHFALATPFSRPDFVW